MNLKMLMAGVAMMSGATMAATTYTWDATRLTGGYFDPVSWGVDTFEPVNGDTLSFTGGHVFEPTFAADAGRLSITGMWNVAKSNTLKIAAPSGTEIYLGDQFGLNTDKAPAVFGTLDLSGKVTIRGCDNATFGAFKAYGESLVDIHGAGTVVGGVDNAKGQPGINGAYGSQNRMKFCVRDGATVTNLFYFMGNCVGPVFDFSGSNTVVRNFSFKNNGNFRMQEGKGYFTNGVTLADCSDLNFSGYSNTVYIDRATITNTALAVSGSMYVDHDSRFFCKSSLSLEGNGRRLEIGGGSYVQALGANPGLKVLAMQDSELVVSGQDTLLEVLANGSWGGIVRIGTETNKNTPYENFQSRLTVKDGAQMLIGAKPGIDITSSSHVGINIGQKAAGEPADHNEMMVLNGAIVSNLASTVVGGGYQAYAGSDNRLVVSNATFYTRYVMTIGDNNIQDGRPSTNNCLEVLDGAQATLGGYLRIGNSSASKVGRSRCRVENATLNGSDVIYFAGGDDYWGRSTLEIGGTNGYVRGKSLSLPSGSQASLKFNVARAGRSTDLPFLDFFYSATMSIPESGVDADVKIDYGWATSGRKNHVDLMRISRGGSAADYPKQSARLTTIMNSIPKASLGACTLSIVTNAADTAFSAHGTYTLRLNAGPRQGLILLLK